MHTCTILQFGVILPYIMYIMHLHRYCLIDNSFLSLPFLWTSCHGDSRNFICTNFILWSSFQPGTSRVWSWSNWWKWLSEGRKIGSGSLEPRLEPIRRLGFDVKLKTYKIVVPFMVMYALLLHMVIAYMINTHMVFIAGADLGWKFRGGGTFWE